jgi:hypothetical protein
VTLSRFELSWRAVDAEWEDQSTGMALAEGTRAGVRLSGPDVKRWV